MAAKVEEQPRKLEHVIRVAHMFLRGDKPPLDVKSEEYADQTQQIVINENIMLQTLGNILQTYFKNIILANLGNLSYRIRYCYRSPTYLCCQMESTCQRLVFNLVNVKITLTEVKLIFIKFGYSLEGPSPDLLLHGHQQVVWV